VTFLHRVADGPSSSSYGVEVAKLAGVPDRVVERAREYVREAGGDAATATRPSPDNPREESESGTDRVASTSDRGDTLAAYVEGLENGDHDDAEGNTDAERDVLEALRDVEVARTTPLEALNTLEDLQRRLDE